MPRLLLPTVLFLSALPVTAHATIILDLTIEQMTEAAPLVLVGEVRGIHVDHNRSRTKIYTWISVAPTEVLKGSAPGELVTVKIIGGQVGNTVAELRGTPRFRRGERVLLFLEPRKDGDGYLTIGMFMGKFSLFEDAETGALLVSRPAPGPGVMLAGPDHGGARETVLPLRDVRDIVTRIGDAR